MNRRNAIRTALLFSAGTALLPSCLHNDKNVTTLKNIKVTPDDEKMMAALAETIIPTTNFVGATGVQAWQFTLMMADECYNPEKQKIFNNGLQQFKKLVKDKYNTSFTDCSSQQKNEVVALLEQKAVKGDAAEFYQMTRGHVLQAFTSSKPYMVDVRHYNMVPGPNFKGCVKI